jgi:hypothetical protein
MMRDAGYTGASVAAQEPGPASRHIERDHFHDAQRPRPWCYCEYRRVGFGDVIDALWRISNAEHRNCWNSDMPDGRSRGGQRLTVKRCDRDV